ncbi:hypothetical protein MAPG_09723 [Magnaporthiopsis poae ATCC 64411]|uniref:Interferon-induced GTP-binding protein Mx2 n=1 Tax=Magnaporthiopsis poae (strain ATCC 64411 / 73-15) TaxID=644358 RepID=A0A0C4EAP6_MAGP6|nr:hypothetical protein MAPG_09723 [Magnaporthiopsis poae ATCC 64411]
MLDPRQLFSDPRESSIFSKIFRTFKTPSSGPKPPQPNMTVNGTTQGGLLSQGLLAKIDRLREANVGAFIPLPQLVVVGDQSSGKSSVLESLTGFYFPRAAGLCTRYATQISCCRDPQKSVVISIIPRPDAGEELKVKLLKFRRQMTEIDNDELAAIFEDANEAMGIRMNMDAPGSSRSGDAFSEDILKIEINGPEQNHLTVIDVPGIFRVPTPGLTTKNDISTVRNMIERYMANRRTIILAVIPCNVDINTQEILKLAETADPEGVRTMGVMTKPDLATEKATQKAVVDLLSGIRNPLKLGYHVVKNRGADDEDSTLHDRLADEKAFFMSSPWSSVADHCGIPALKLRLGDLLMQISKTEFPQVKGEIEAKLRQRRTELEAMGASRVDAIAQRQFLGNLAAKFQNLAQSAVGGHYDSHRAFTDDEELKLITKILKLNDSFSNLFAVHGHKYRFDRPAKDAREDYENAESDGSENSDCDSDNQDHDAKESPLETQDEGIKRDDIVRATTVFKDCIKIYEKHSDEFVPLDTVCDSIDFFCPAPLESGIMKVIEQVYDTSRGPELGTFGGGVFTTVFRKQSENWEPLTLAYASKAIVLVHDFISRLLHTLCPDADTREQVYQQLLVDKLLETYKRAMDHARFLLNVERFSRPMTVNHYFNATQQSSRGERLFGQLEKIAFKTEDGSSVVKVNAMKHCATDKENAQQVREDILDTLISYYKIARKRLVDVVCLHVVYHYLLESPESPLHIFSPALVMGLDDEQLAAVAGEAAETTRRRQALAREIESLELGVRILRS